MEKVLAYDRSIVAQETGYWCGPAATQVVLNGRGIRRTEADLARRMGTDTDGTGVGHGCEVRCHRFRLRPVPRDAHPAPAAR